MKSALDAPIIMDTHVNKPLSYTRSVKSFRDKMAMGDGISGTSLTALPPMQTARKPPINGAVKGTNNFENRSRSSAQMKTMDADRRSNMSKVAS